MGASTQNKLDDLTFFSMLSLLQGGMWLLNDLEIYLKPFGLSQGRLSILLAITESQTEIISPGDLARRTAKSRPTVTRMIERLDKDGLITIHSDKDDRRSKILSLTDKATKLLEKVIPVYNERIRLMSAALNDGDKRRLITLISKIDFLDADRVIRVR
jgi:DNA-binding MarR family transcriptional regulator